MGLGFFWLAISPHCRSAGDHKEHVIFLGLFDDF
jgi:hypothetical protein